MANSMTGFGRGEASVSGYRVSIELKSVNHRFLEIFVRAPRQLNSIEEKIRKMLQEKFRRGRIEVYVNVMESEGMQSVVKVDKDIVLSYDKSLRDLALALHTVYETDIYRLVALPEALSIKEPEVDLDILWAACSEALSIASDNLGKMRCMEGEKLTFDLLQRFDLLAEYMQVIAERAPYVVTDYQVRLQDRIKTLLGEVELDAARLANEVAYFADRASITEELVRFDSHLAQGREALSSSNGSVGRRLDFLIQEMNREINTIGSKANDLEIGQQVVNVKSELEKVREQIQNLE